MKIQMSIKKRKVLNYDVQPDTALTNYTQILRTVTCSWLENCRKGKSDTNGQKNHKYIKANFVLLSVCS